MIGHPMQAHHEFAGIPKFKELEAKYLPTADVATRYTGAIGL